MSEPLAALNRLALSLSNSFYLLPQFLSPLAPFPRAPPPPAAGRVRPRPSPRGGSTSARHLGTRAALPAPARRRPSPAPSARRGYNCFSPPGGVILGVVGGGGGGGGEEGSFLVPPFPGGGSGVGGHRFQVSSGGRTAGWGRPRAGAGGAGGGGWGRRAAGGWAQVEHAFFDLALWGAGALVGEGKEGKAFRVSQPPFFLSQASLKCSRACPPPYPFLVSGDPHPYVVPENVHLGLFFHPPCIYTPFYVCIRVCMLGVAFRKEFAAN